MVVCTSSSGGYNPVITSPPTAHLALSFGQLPFRPCFIMLARTMLAAGRNISQRHSSSWSSYWRWTIATQCLVCLISTSCGTQDRDGSVRCNSLRLMKEILRRHPSDVSEFSDQLITRVLEAYADTDCNVSVAAEEMFGQLAISLPTKTIIDQLIPATSQPSDSTSLLGVIKFLSKVRREAVGGWCS